ncbi:hypothetical protein C8R41DRAFT_533584 [Lentinula lateritia]|uniref:Transmembrane protein n=1 Tax=Lentinula lateritia TaxID=40482 RepID=A0ABQ8V6F2_9AGAR|nr:hypothetical protein C8R41DRAFT_533584 [Lentinula lateritia]
MIIWDYSLISGLLLINSLFEVRFEGTIGMGSIQPIAASKSGEVGDSSPLAPQLPPLSRQAQPDRTRISSPSASTGRLTTTSELDSEPAPHLPPLRLGSQFAPESVLLQMPLRTTLLPPRSIGPSYVVEPEPVWDSYSSRSLSLSSSSGETQQDFPIADVPTPTHRTLSKPTQHGIQITMSHWRWLLTIVVFILSIGSAFAGYKNNSIAVIVVGVVTAVASLISFVISQWSETHKMNQGSSTHQILHNLDQTQAPARETIRLPELSFNRGPSIEASNSNPLNLSQHRVFQSLEGRIFTGSSSLEINGGELNEVRKRHNQSEKKEE